MKILLFFLIITNSIIVYAHENIINETILLIGKTPPKSFTQINEISYENENFYSYNVFLLIHREFDLNLVTLCEISNRFSKLDDGRKWQEQFYIIVEENNWKYLGRFYNDDLYSKNGIFLVIKEPYLTQAHDIYANITITYDLEFLYEGILTSDVINNLRNQ